MQQHHNFFLQSYENKMGSSCGGVTTPQLSQGLMLNDYLSADANNPVSQGGTRPKMIKPIF